MKSQLGDPRPVGVFDSGVGGLSIVQAIRSLLPWENMVYLADTIHCPYGPRPPDEIRQLARDAAGELVARGAKTIVVACNTASVAALALLRETYPLPFVGIVPAIKPAANATRRRRIGVLATEATLHGELFNELVAQFARDIVVVKQAAPDLVMLVERGISSGPQVDELLHTHLKPMLADGVDSLVLGCTHYPFLRPAIERLAGSSLQVFDTGEPVARQLARLMTARQLRNQSRHPGWLSLLTSGDPEVVRPVAELLLGEQLVRAERWCSPSSASGGRSAA